MRAFITFLALVAVVSLAQSNDVCHNYVVCPISCPEHGQSALQAIIMPMFTFQDFRTNMDNAIEYIKKFPGVIKTDGGVKLHTSLNCKLIHLYLVLILESRVREIIKNFVPD
jgi:hypothetical protein